MVTILWRKNAKAGDEVLQSVLSYRTHIPGAIHFDLFKNVHTTDLHPRNLPDAPTFTQNARDAGVNNESHVVVYDAEGKGGFFLGSRAWFTFKVFQFCCCSSS